MFGVQRMDSNNMGLEEGDQWMPIAIDMEQVESIKLCGEDEFVGNDKATLNFRSGVSFTIDVIFKKAVEQWDRHYATRI